VSGITIRFGEAFEQQQKLAKKALEQLHALEESLKGLLPGEEPETGDLRGDILRGLQSLAEIESLINEQWFRNRG